MSSKWLQSGFMLGALATLAMTVVMLAGVASSLSPMPDPVPMAIITKLLGKDPAKPLRLTLALAAHFAYGGLWAMLLYRVARPVTFGKGIALGVGLWIVMQITVLPLLGWGLFGSRIDPQIGVATLALHLVYGATLGLIGQFTDQRIVPVATVGPGR